MTRSLHPRCAGSVFYGPHSAKVPAAYTLIDPAGRVRYFCDTDCLRRTLEADVQRAMQPAVVRSVALVRGGGVR